MFNFNEEEFLVWEEATNDTIDFKRIYVDVADGDLVSGLLLSQIIYWNLPSKNPEKKDKKTGKKHKLKVKKRSQMTGQVHYWLAKGRNDWYEECRISAKQFDRAVKILEKLGLIEKDLFKFNNNPTIHVRIRWENFLPALKITLDERRKEEEEREKEEQEQQEQQERNSVEEEEVIVEENPVIDQRGKTDEPASAVVIPQTVKTDEPLQDMVIDQKVNSFLPKGENGISPKGKIEIPVSVKSLTENTTEITNTEYITENHLISSSSNRVLAPNLIEEEEEEEEEEEKKEINQYTISFLRNHLGYDDLQIQSIKKWMMKFGIYILTEEEMKNQHSSMIRKIEEEKTRIWDWGFYFVNGVINFRPSEKVMKKHHELQKEVKSQKNVKGVRQPIPFYNWLED